METSLANNQFFPKLLMRVTIYLVRREARTGNADVIIDKISEAIAPLLEA